jgi:hypothetical protein
MSCNCLTSVVALNVALTKLSKYGFVCLCVSQYSMASTVTRLWTGPVRNHGLIPPCFILQSAKTGCEADPASYSVDTTGPFLAISVSGA